MNLFCYLFYLQFLFVNGLFGFQRGRLGKVQPQDVLLAKYERWFTQFLDHFNPSATRTWKQRYFVNDQYYKPEGPVFLMIGGEGEAEVEWMTNGAWIDSAKKFGALCFQLEHRFYGKSHPTENLSLENLRYLTSQQALEDIARFIVAINRKHDLPKNTKWISFGGSYPGSLAAWSRLKYPHLVHGAMSASSPLRAQVDYSGYYKVVTDAISTYSNESFSGVKEAFLEFDRLLQSKSGQKTINKKFQLCNPIENSINNANEVAELYSALTYPFASVQMYGSNLTFLNVSDKMGFDVVCNIMANTSLGYPLDRLVTVVNLLLDSSNKKCLDYDFDKKVNAYKNVSWNHPTPGNIDFWGRPWFYQTCTEFGFYQTLSAPPQIFGNKMPLMYFIQQCIDVFGEEYNLRFVNNAVSRTNTIYGGKDIDVNNVVFVQGSLDPWYPAGIIKTIKKGAPAIFINGTTHMANMFPESADDLPQLKDARRQVDEYIRIWIGE